MSLQVIGAGYGRTGTKSLQLALEQLGYNKCYHMEALLRNPEGVKHWKNAMQSTPVDWDQLFDGYQAIVDFPGSLYYKELSAHYPEAKIVLSYRDPESWYQSAYSTIYGFDPGVLFKLRLLLSATYSSTARNLIKVFLFNQKSLWDIHFEGKFQDKAATIQNYIDHVEAVKAYFPAEQLLVHQAPDGWEPLCRFLGKNIPSTPYPRSNKKSDFATWSTGLVAETLSW